MTAVDVTRPDDDSVTGLLEHVSDMCDAGSGGGAEYRVDVTVDVEASDGTAVDETGLGFGRVDCQRDAVALHR